MSNEPARASEVDKPIRVVIQQPNLARYRLPVYQELSKRPGLDVHLLYGNDSDIPSVEPVGVKATMVPMSKFRLFGNEARWHSAQTKWTDQKHADVVVLSWSTRYMSLVPALLKARRQHIGTVLWGHGYSKRETAVSMKARSGVAQLADALLFYNRSTARQYVDAGYANPMRVFVAFNTLDQTEIQAARNEWLGQPEKLEAFRAQHGLAGKQSVLFVSRFDPKNRLDLLIRALVKLRDSNPNLVVNIIGKGEAEGELRVLTKQLGLEDRVFFRGAIYGEQQLAPWFLTAKAFVYPANIGLSAIHAFGYALPVVTADEPNAQNPEFESLQHGYNSLLYTPERVDELAEAVGELCRDGERQAAMSRNAHQTITERHSLKRMVDGMEQAIRYADHCARRLRPEKMRVSNALLSFFSAIFLAELPAWCML
ncbi:MAG: glycosyltransferase family 4 protein [Phycisphaerales bacterium]